MRSTPLLTSAALAAALFAAAPALADEHGAAQAPKDGVSTTTTERDGTVVTTTDPQAAQGGAASAGGEQAASVPAGAMELVGKSVIGQNGDEVGEIKNVLVDGQGQATHVILGHGGWMGMGEKSVALGFDQIQVGAEQISVGMNDEQLSQMPEYQSPDEQREAQQASPPPMTSGTATEQQQQAPQQTGEVRSAPGPSGVRPQSTPGVAAEPLTPKPAD